MGLVDDLARLPWDRVDGESSRNYHNFLHWLRLDPYRRAMRTAYADHQTQCLQKPPTKAAVPHDWNVLRLKFSWVERALAADRDAAERLRLQQIADTAAMRLKHIAIATAAQNLCVQQLNQWLQSNTIPQMTPVQLLRVFSMAVAVERTARGQPAEIVEHRREATSHGLLICPP